MFDLAIVFYNNEVVHGGLMSLAFGAMGIALLILGHKLFHAIDFGVG